MNTKIDISDEDKLILSFTLDEAVHLVFSETPAFVLVYRSRAHRAAETPQSLLLRKERDLIDQRDLFMDARDKHKQGTAEWEKFEAAARLSSQQMEGLLNGEEVGIDYAYPPNVILMLQTANEQNGYRRLVRLSDFVQWCLYQGYPVQDPYAELVKIATHGAPIEVDFLVNLDAWELPRAVRAVFGDIGSNWKEDRSILGLNLSDECSEPDYASHLARCRERGLQPLDVTDFLLAKTPEYLLAMSAIRAGKIATFPDDSQVFPVVDPSSFLRWVRSKGFTIPRRLRVLLAAKSRQEIFPLNIRKDNEGSLIELEQRNTLEDTTAKIWTTHSQDGAFHLSTATQGIQDGVAEFRFGNKNTELISILCNRWPEGLKFRDILDKVYGEELEKLRSSRDGEDARNLLKKVRTLVSDLRNKLRKHGIPPDIIPPVHSDHAIESTEIRLEVKRLTNLDEKRAEARP